jgi:hypothetical protein
LFCAEMAMVPCSVSPVVYGTIKELLN